MRGLLNAKRLIGKIAYSGLTDPGDIEIRRKVFLVNLFCVVGLSYLLIAGIGAVLNARFMLASVVLVSSALALANFFYLRYSGNYQRAGHVVVAIISSVFIYLLCSGGVANTGPLWCYSAVPLILCLYGSRKGLVLIAALTLFSALVLFMPDMPLLMTTYPVEFKTRFLASFIAVVIMALVHEYAREESYLSMLEAQQIMNHEARTDPLTGLANRREMYEQIEKVLEGAKQRDCSLSLLLCDMDNFKAINDRYGHRCGDQVLVAVARLFIDTFRGEDIVARWGGEEFLVMLPCTQGVDAYALAEKIRLRVAELHIEHGDQVIPLSLSIGTRQYDMQKTIDQNIAQADRCLYRAKQQGRNRTVADVAIVEQLHDTRSECKLQASSV